MSLRLGFDMDGVLADFRSAFARAAHGHVEPDSAEPEHADVEALTSHQVRRVWTRIQTTPNWWTGLDPFEPAQIRRLHDLTRRHRWEVVFMTKRPPTAGDPVQFQTQYWLEQQGFFHPAVVTVPGSRGELANALKLDLIVDDQLYNCVDIVTGSHTRALLLLRDALPSLEAQAVERGIGVARSLEQALDVLEGLARPQAERKGRLRRVSEWLRPARDASLPARPDVDRAPLNPGGTKTGDADGR